MNKVDIFLKTSYPDCNKWSPGFFDIETFDVVDNDELYVSIKGSDAIKNSLMDWLMNLLVIPFPSIAHRRLVHLGFLIRERKLHKKLLKRLDELNIKKIYFGGHSMGATLAGLLQDRFTRHYAYDTEAYLYAPGRCWFLFRSKLKDTKAYRYGYDIVPLILFPYINFKYERIGKGKNIFFDHFPKNYRRELNAENK